MIDQLLALPHYCILVHSSADICAHNFDRLRHLANNIDVNDRLTFSQLQNQLIIELQAAAQAVLDDVNNQIANSDELNQPLFEFGRHLFLSLALMELFRIFHFTEVSIIPCLMLNLLVWYRKFAKNGIDLLLTTDNNENGYIGILVSSFLTFDLNESKKAIGKLRIRQYLEDDSLEILQELIDLCPIDIENLESFDIDSNFITNYNNWKKKCSISLKKFKNDQIRLMLTILAGNGTLDTFEKLNSYLNFKDDYKLFLINQLHCDINISQEEFHQSAIFFFEQDYEELLNYEKSIIYLFKGDDLLFFTLMVKSLNIWWLPMHLIHIYYAYQELSDETSEIFESIIIKHLNSILDFSECSWQVVLMFCKEILPRNKPFIEKILQKATIKSLDDVYKIMTEAEINNLNLSYFESLMSQKLTKAYRFDDFNQFLLKVSDPVPCLMNLIKVLSYCLDKYGDLRGFSGLNYHEKLSENSLILNCLNRLVKIVDLIRDEKFEASMEHLLIDEKPLICFQLIYRSIITKAIESKSLSSKTILRIVDQFLPLMSIDHIPFNIKDLI